jgi:hypothetical protein
MKNGGKWNGKQLIRKDLLDELVKGSKANPAYGVTWWLNHPARIRIAVRSAVKKQKDREVGPYDGPVIFLWPPEPAISGSISYGRSIWLSSAKAERTMDDQEFLGCLLLGRFSSN